MRSRTATVTAALLAVLAGGCSTPELVVDDLLPAQAPSRPGTPTVHDDWESCVQVLPAVGTHDPLGEKQSAIERFDQEAFSLPLLGDDFVAVAAISCGGSAQERTDGGYDWVVEEARAVDVNVMLAALRLPDQIQDAEVCTMDLPAVPRLFLLDGDGRWIRPGIPVDACGKPRREISEAHRGLVTAAASRRVVG